MEGERRTNTASLGIPSDSSRNGQTAIMGPWHSRKPHLRKQVQSSFLYDRGIVPTASAESVAQKEHFIRPSSVPILRVFQGFPGRACCDKVRSKIVVELPLGVSIGDPVQLASEILRAAMNEPRNARPVAARGMVQTHCRAGYHWTR